MKGRLAEAGPPTTVGTVGGDREGRRTPEAGRIPIVVFYLIDTGWKGELLGGITLPGSDGRARSDGEAVAVIECSDETRTSGRDSGLGNQRGGGNGKDAEGDS